MHARTTEHDTANAVLSHLPALVPLDDAAGALHVTERTVRRWLRLGKLRAYRTAPGGSGRVLIARDELGRFLATLAQPVPFTGTR
ncbi:MAG: excisionase family DNA-binding protein [Planctomycetes bacterium]|nr:excisionase family DNA-binding protein [Planctomycetota bacterium]